MRRLTLAALLLLLPASGWAQNGSFIRYHPPGGGGSGSGDCDPAQWSSPTGDIVVGGIVGACTLGVDGSTISHYSTGAGTVPATGTAADMHIETDIKRVSFYANTDDPISLVSLYDTSTAGFGFVIDEDSMATDSATKVPTQQSVKAYVDAQAGGSFDPSTSLDIYEDFLGGSLTTTGTIGVTGLTASLASSGTVGVVLGTATNPGVLDLIPSNTDNAGASIYWNSGSKFDAAIWTNYAWTLDGVVVFSGSVTNTAFWFGLSTSASAVTSAAGGIWITRDTDLGHAAFVAAICDATGANGCQSAGDDTDQQSAASTITPTAGTTGTRFRIVHEPTGGPGSTRKISMRVNDETPITFCSSTCTDTIDDLPAVSLIPVVGHYARAANGATWLASVDYLHLTISGLARY